MSEYSESAPKQCPRFDFCCVNDCPLCPGHESFDCDPMPKCTLAKSIRLRIGQKCKLPNLGLTSREFNARKKWEDMPQEIKDRKLAKLKEISPFSQLKAKGYGIVRVRQDRPDFTQEKDPKEASDKAGEGTSEGSQELK